jgi:rRNA maturation endonuclease Nob1
LTTVFAFIIIAAAIFAISYPFLLQRRRGAYSLSEENRNQTVDLNFRKESLYTTIKELDFDFRTGKLSPEDYEELRGKYREKAMALLLEMEKGGFPGDIDRKIEEDIKLRRKSADERLAAQGAYKGKGNRRRVTCARCGKESLSQNKFCPYCGKKLSASD